MRRAKIILATVALLAGCSVTNTGNPATPDGVELIRSKLEREKPDAPASDLLALGNGNRAFAFDLYEQLAANDDGNLFFSPYSVSAALAMVYAGAAGSTASEAAAGLHYDLPEPNLHGAFNQVDATLRARAHDGVQLSIMNAAWTGEGTPFEQTYLDTLALKYGAGIYAIDFATGAVDPSVPINDWVSEQTHGRIPELFAPGSLTPDVALVLTNTVYFKAKWENAFDKRDTKDEPFHAPARDVLVPMMHAGGLDVRYLDGDGFQAFELPYKAPELRMLFVLPDVGNDAPIERGLADVFAAVRSGLAARFVVYSMPRFSYRTNAELVAPLQALGVQQLFSETSADLSRMSSVPLYVSQILHDAFVLVDEEGTEAAAATGVKVATPVSAPPPPITIVLDRPFLYAIYDEPTGEILFLGRVRDPSEQP